MREGLGEHSVGLWHHTHGSGNSRSKYKTEYFELRWIPFPDTTETGAQSIINRKGQRSGGDGQGDIPSGCFHWAGRAECFLRTSGTLGPGSSAA